ncbi:hypothetical protein F4560_001625 [Saccharothrix ecbatanensis]|uniref:Uncharacterized protein n=1 Tax=Saccharothrix ecbatanensis TaxID=1105145 RepID=A0A7W9HGJ9_9PSEU|nr:hypothetical protein [Saccharothrix ecbatanensis]MBB5801857.1 hypothetical protein [Saccharothrix ecbatanensis]
MAGPGEAITALEALDPSPMFGGQLSPATATPFDPAAHRDRTDAGRPGLPGLPGADRRLPVRTHSTLRLTINAAHSEEHLLGMIAVLQELQPRLGF